MSDSNLSHFNSEFVQSLGLALELEANGKTVKIVSGNIERFNLNLYSYGHNWAIQFSALNELVDPLFAGPDVTRATLTFYTVVNEALTGPPLIVLKGIVTEKCFQRMFTEVGGSNQPLRLYEISVADNAKATWGQHYPINAYVDLSMKDVIEKHKNPEILIKKYEYDKLEIKHPITAFSLEHKDWLPEEQQVNFYSFITWYLQQENGIWAYDYKTNDYSVLGKKVKAPGKPVELMDLWVTSPSCLFPRTVRFNSKKRKHTFDSAESEDKDNPHAFKSVRREFIQSENYRSFPEQAHETVNSALAPEKKIVKVDLIYNQKFLLDQLLPGLSVKFEANQANYWSSDPIFKDKTFRVQSLFIQADKSSVAQESSVPVQEYRQKVKILLEEEDEPFVPRPPFTPPIYPFAIQGKIFSDVGDKEQSTFKIQESEKAPQGQYLVQVPLLEDDSKKIVVPFTPDFINGQFYFPYTKGQKVELSLYFRTAKILRPSDWQPFARLPNGVQGNQIVLASNGKDKLMMMRHEYKDGKTSIFTIQQISSDTKTQTIQIQEQDIAISVEEKDKEQMSIQMKNGTGLVLTWKDKSKGSLQQTVYDGKSMTHTCSGDDGDTTITQKPDSIVFSSNKKFMVSAEEISFDAKDKITLIGKNKITVQGKVVEAPASKANLCS